ncbi:MAG: GNAT family N-acetyltransferase [Paracoccaceae bacterium]
MTQQDIDIELVQRIDQIGQQDWDSCACPEAQDGRAPIDPFTTFRFLAALESSGSVGVGTGWQPQYLVARVEGRVIGTAPMYVKSHSQGEYVFDHSWAHALERAGGRYYPKLQIAVPFTPATGRRFLTHPDFQDVGLRALVQGAIQIADQNNLSSLHATFCTQTEADSAAEIGLMPRTTQQYHWQNDNYADFDAFLASLSSRKRKNIRKERAQAANFGGQVHMLTGDDLHPKHWDAFWQFYQDTGARKWGTPYLTRAFFDAVQEQMRDDVVLALAERQGRYVAGALNFLGRESLYGRYWGCCEDHPCLHFELCYYRAIDFAIENGLARVEAGAQGDHKLARGYLPTPCHSVHWIRDPGFAHAVDDYLQAERSAVAEDIEILTSYGPFRKVNVEEQQ